jgi:flavin-dependent dehydrogenase
VEQALMVRATLDLDTAATTAWDTVVVGAGPAGGMAAYQLARRGVTTLLVDKASFPRWKVCGACLNGPALATLAAAGLGDLTIRQAAVPLHEVRLGARGRVAAVALSGWAALSRTVLDTALVRAAVEAGAAFLPGTRATLTPGVQGLLRTTYTSPQRQQGILNPCWRCGLERKPGCRTLLFRQGERTVAVVARVVLAADGLGGRLLAGEGDFQTPAADGSRIGAGVIAEQAPAFYDLHRIYMACGSEGYVGLVRLEDGRLNLAAALAPGLLQRLGGPGRAAAAILRQTDWPPVPGVEELPWRGTPGLTRRASRLAGERVFVLGDAAGYVEPFTGEGMAWALAAGAAVTPLALRALHNWEPALGRAWAGLHRQRIVRRQTMCRVAAQVLRHPLLVRSLIALLARAPGLAAPFIAHLNATA